MINESGIKYLQFLSMIVGKPGMFGVNRVEDINMMIFGYTYASPDSYASNLMAEFTDFSIEHFKFKETFHWARLIRLYSGSDSHSIELFTLTFSRFLEEKYKQTFPISPR